MPDFAFFSLFRERPMFIMIFVSKNFLSNFCLFVFCARCKLVASGQSLFYGQMDSSSLNFGINFTLQFRLFKRNSGITQAICDDYLYFQLFNLCLVKLGTFLCLLATENLSLLCFKLIRP